MIIKLNGKLSPPENNSAKVTLFLYASNSPYEVKIEQVLSKKVDLEANVLH
jgi:hypothetical protein